MKEYAQLILSMEIEVVTSVSRHNISVVCLQLRDFAFFPCIFQCIFIFAVEFALINA